MVHPADSQYRLVVEHQRDLDSQLLAARRRARRTSGGGRPRVLSRIVNRRS